MRFVSPETVRIDLADTVTRDGEGKEVRTKNWIDVKAELSVGEDKAYRAAGFGRMSRSAGDDSAATNSVDVDWKMLAFGRALAYIVDWSEKRAFNRSALEALAAEDFDEIDKGILAHIDKMDAEKKARAGSPRSTAGSA